MQTKVISISSIFTTIFALCIGTSAFAEKKDTPQSLDGTTLITAEQLIDLVDTKDDLVIIDSRKPSDRALGYIPGSIALPNTDTTPESLATHLESKTTPVVFYCNGAKCARSYEAAEIAVKDGYSEIYWFRTGWAAWEDSGYPIEK